MSIAIRTQADWAQLYEEHPAGARAYLRTAIQGDFGLSLPDRIFTHGHSCPFDFIADAFFHPGKDVAGWANRSGIKTLGASILAALEFRYNRGLQARVLSGSLLEGGFLFKYWKEWCYGILAGYLDAKPLERRSRVNGGEYQILAASEKHIRGGKVHRLFEDEVDTVDPDLDEAATGMLTSVGHPARTVFTSTWHKSDGLMQKLIDACPANGVTLHKWSVWESIAQCPPERHKHGDGCDDCPMAPACVGKAQQFHADPARRIGIAAEANGLFPVDMAIKMFRRVGKRTWEAEYECKRPSIKGLVYDDFDADVHRCINPPDSYKEIIRAVDWGRRVFACLWIGIDKDENYYVLDTYRAEEGLVSQHAAYIKAHKLQKISTTYVDPSGQSKNEQTGKRNTEVFESAGIPCRWVTAGRLINVMNGIGWVRDALNPASGPPRLHYIDTPNNKMFVRAMQSYHNKKLHGIFLDEPQKPQDWDHLCDCLRYTYANRQTSGAIGVVGLSAS